MELLILNIPICNPNFDDWPQTCKTTQLTKHRKSDIHISVVADAYMEPTIKKTLLTVYVPKNMPDKFDPSCLDK